MDFDLLSVARKEVQEFSRLHSASVAAFAAPGQSWFKIDVDEPASTERVRHKTTTASCVESLGDLYAARQESSEELRDLATAFGQNALAQAQGRWESEGAAFVYCRVRTLPAILAYASKDSLESRSRKLLDHLDFVWDKVDVEPRRQGIYEQPSFTKKAEESPTYPPNAFHTFWALRTLHLARRLSSLQGELDKFTQARHIAMLWTQSVLASQTALCRADADRADAHQLAWALAAQFADPTDTDELAVGEFARPAIYRSALEAFFCQQRENGSWPLGQPLFHYPKAGNAYCYTFETLAELLRPALRVSTGRVYRDLLRRHVPDLLRAWTHLRTTALPLNDDGTAVGWCSGHHPHRTYAEGWATAVAFSFMQCLRRLLGIWTRDEAGRILGVRPPHHETRADALKEFIARGQTWTDGKHWSAGEQLAALFLHPVNATTVLTDDEDPDLFLVDEKQARSAILFGPPGTSKTSLAESLAGAIGWEFVEVHASHFLRDGMDQVPRRADEIFSQLMELDHCVVLFDEIDELLRKRGFGSDPFGRFLTTSMLPKVARLWGQRRVLFFVAMNDITQADEAIQRSQRFDAAVFVPPPSFDAKARLLRQRLGEGVPPFDADAVERDLREAGTPSDHPFGFFALLRHDQIDEFGDLIKSDPKNDAVSKEALRNVGSHMPDEAKAFRNFINMREQERRDHRTLRLLWVDGSKVKLLDGLEVFRESPEDTYVSVLGYEERPPPKIQVAGKGARPDEALRYTTT